MSGKVEIAHDSRYDKAWKNKSRCKPFLTKLPVWQKFSDCVRLLLSVQPSIFTQVSEGKDKYFYMLPLRWVELPSVILHIYCCSSGTIFVSHFSGTVKTHVTYQDSHSTSVSVGLSMKKLSEKQN